MNRGYSKQGLSRRQCYENAERDRQAVLDVINEKPGAILSEIEAATGLSKRKAAQVVLSLEDKNEIFRVDGPDDGPKTPAGVPCLKAYANVFKTVSAAELLARVIENIKGSQYTKTMTAAEIRAKIRAESKVKRKAKRKAKQKIKEATPAKVSPVVRLFGGL